MSSASSSRSRASEAWTLPLRSATSALMRLRSVLASMSSRETRRNAVCISDADAECIPWASFAALSASAWVARRSSTSCACRARSSAMAECTEVFEYLRSFSSSAFSRSTESTRARSSSASAAVDPSASECVLCMPAMRLP
eukprot:Amastigsp_a2950_48.p4 type:complete len:141 gc:universal Amastigsp_a2950_48:913-491(-)